MRIELEDAMQAHRVKDERIRELEAEVVTLGDSLFTARDEIARQTQRAERWKDERDELFAKSETLEAEVARLRDNCAHWNDIYDNSCAEVKELTGLLKQAGAECQEWKDEAARLQRIIERARDFDPQLIDGIEEVLALSK